MSDTDLAHTNLAGNNLTRTAVAGTGDMDDVSEVRGFRRVWRQQEKSCPAWWEATYVNSVILHK